MSMNNNKQSSKPQSQKYVLLESRSSNIQNYNKIITTVDYNNNIIRIQLSNNKLCTGIYMLIIGIRVEKKKINFRMKTVSQTLD